jgi:hypothetical protein
MNSDLIKRNYEQIIKLSQIALKYLDNMTLHQDSELKLLRINLELNKLLVVTTQLNRLYMESSFDPKDLESSFKNMDI